MKIQTSHDAMLINCLNAVRACYPEFTHEQIYDLFHRCRSIDVVISTVRDAAKHGHPLTPNEINYL